MRLLDTDVMVDIRRQFPPAVAWLITVPERPGLPGLVAMELVEGCRDGREVRALMRQIATFQIYWPTEADQERALQTYTRAHLSHRLGLIDALIGGVRRWAVGDPLHLQRPALSGDASPGNRTTLPPVTGETDPGSDL